MIGLVTSALFLASNAICNAQAALKQEPLQVMQQGSSVLVDDGTCGKGKIKQVNAGTGIKWSGTSAGRWTRLTAPPTRSTLATADEVNE